MYKYIIINSTYNYPKGYSAANTKFRYLAMGIVSRRPCYIIEGVDNASNCSVTRENKIICIKYKNDNFLLKILGPLFILLRMCKHSSDNDFIILTSSPKFRLLFSLLVFKSIHKRVKIGYVFHEWHVATNISFGAKLKSYLYDNFAGYLFNLILPISSFLENKSRKFHKPIIKLPILFHYDNNPKSDCVPLYNTNITYCGQIDYYRVIKIIINVAEHYSKVKDEIFFNLVLYGNQNQIDKLRDEIENKQLKDVISIYQNVQDSQLQKMYRESLALLIPLSKQSIQDKARFSQKIAEYISSGRPIITNDVGDITIYFKDKKSAIILTDLTFDSLYEGISYLKANKSLANTIGMNGFSIGKEYFEYKKISNKIIDQIELL